MDLNFLVRHVVRSDLTPDEICSMSSLCDSPLERDEFECSVPNTEASLSRADPTGSARPSHAAV